eukprot:TRINITY_DN19035_c0_g1::TRINITY_DN19035_c0_g1_i1::g.13942::m.13942 TRINITY_DN19035_c0_g1::TRINITY_DN19035_c0_g1_i1::g.13942  ORF type:complete len:544 (+),score=140.96,sp/Q9FMU5/UTP18_ARATH/47.02/4e-134,WD40/PF00400.27/13,WD40/PF00400.27/2e+02,WD40/PF00400.27/0.0013,WD40/PF00400.27/0.13,WD40/PF00400.27/47,WD40/PF00400.27/1.8e+02,eIF2A/PF08662.6/50,eIF2A/PF08662.6/2.8,eIF2A/PF08662.6/2.8e+03,DUF4591/PF15261.1/3.6e+02,DUF4591/PF15261.1/5 TRINITY_DN19035_c0_g1_i1:77-1633(+)
MGRKSEKKEEKQRKNREVEKSLESFLFGKPSEEDDTTPRPQKRQKVAKEEKKKKEDRSFVLGLNKPRMVDADSDPDGDEDEVVTPAAKEEEVSEAPVERKSAWVDEDDEKVKIDITSANRLKKLRKHEKETKLSGVEYSKRLREQHERINSGHKWAQIPDNSKETIDSDDEENDDDEGHLRKAGKLILRQQGGPLPKGHIHVNQRKDANVADPSKAVVRTSVFHRNGQLLMTAGLDKALRFFMIDGKENPKVQSVFLEDMPIYTAAFSPAGNEVIASGRRKYFYTYDMNAASIKKIHSLQGREDKSIEKFIISPDGQLINFFGNDGFSLLVSMKTKQLIGTMKMNGSLRAAAFTPDSSKLYTSGGDGQVYIWDVKSRQCMHRFADEGAVHSTSIAIDPTGTYLAAGSDSGVVNLYNLDSCAQSATPKPLKAILNLTTTINSLNFNKDGQILAFSSELKKDSFRMFHTPSLTTFSNWPSAQTPLGYVWSTSFSPSSGYVTIGNDKGRALLYRLRHYPTV